MDRQCVINGDNDPIDIKRSNGIGFEYTTIDRNNEHANETDENYFATAYNNIIAVLSEVYTRRHLKPPPAGQRQKTSCARPLHGAETVEGIGMSSTDNVFECATDNTVPMPSGSQPGDYDRFVCSIQLRLPGTSVCTILHYISPHKLTKPNLNNSIIRLLCEVTCSSQNAAFLQLTAPLLFPRPPTTHRLLHTPSPPSSPSVPS